VTEVDPLPLTGADWNQVSATLSFTWAFFLTMIPAAIMFLSAHAVIPSLVITGDVGTLVGRTRPVFYLLAVAGAAAAGWSIVNFIAASEVLRTIYPKVWI
jgi:hypothetical protein